jgi:serine/threonine-protein kinase ATR
MLKIFSHRVLRCCPGTLHFGVTQRAWQLCTDRLFSVSRTIDSNSFSTAKDALGIVTDLESVSDLSAPMNQAFQVVLPSSSSISEFWPESQHFVALPHGLQKTVSCQTGAIYIGFNLLVSLVKSVHKPQGRCTDIAAFEHQQPWVLDTCLVLWQHFKRWTTASDKGSFHDEGVGSYLQVLEAVALPMTASEDHYLGSSKAAQSLVGGLSGLLEKSNLSVSNQTQFASLLIRLRTVLNDLSQTTQGIRRRVHPSSIIADDLEAVIAHFCHNGERFSGLQKDLQVRLAESRHATKLIYPSQHCVYGHRQARGPCKLQMHARSFARI